MTFFLYVHLLHFFVANCLITVFDDASACFCLCSSLTVSCLHMLLYCKVSHCDDDIDLRHVYIVTEYRIVVLGWPYIEYYLCQIETLFQPLHSWCSSRKKVLRLIPNEQIRSLCCLRRSRTVLYHGDITTLWRNALYLVFIYNTRT